MVLLTLFLRQRRLALVLALPLAVNLGLILPLYFHPAWLEPHPEMASQDADRDQGPLLKLMIYNLGGGFTSNEGAMDLIRESEADLIILGGLEPGMLEKLEYAVAPFRVYQAVPRQDGYGVAMLLRVSIRPQVQVIETKPFSLTGNESDGMPQAIQARLLWQGRPVVLLALTASDAMTSQSAALQAKQFAHVTQWVRQQTQPVIVAGDLNTTPWSWTFQNLLAQSGLHNTQAGFGVQGTWPATGSALGQIPLDHCLTDLSLTTVDREIGPSLSSNHYSLLVTLQWTGGAMDLQPGPPADRNDQDGPPSPAPAKRYHHRHRDRADRAGPGAQTRPSSPDSQGARNRQRPPRRQRPAQTRPVEKILPAPTTQP
jgi:endonuclease/exonuclease/phosphatase (EEP) superfamily protein YafD